MARRGEGEERVFEEGRISRDLTKDKKKRRRTGITGDRAISPAGDKSKTTT